MMMMVKFSLDLAYLGQSFHSWRRNSRINRGSIRRTKKFASFFSLERERGKKRRNKGKIEVEKNTIHGTRVLEQYC